MWDILCLLSANVCCMKVYNFYLLGLPNQPLKRVKITGYTTFATMFVATEKKHRSHYKVNIYTCKWAACRAESVQQCSFDRLYVHELFSPFLRGLKFCTRPFFTKKLLIQNQVFVWKIFSYDEVSSPNV